MRKKYEAETIVGLFVLIGLVSIGYVSLNLGDLSFFGESGTDSYRARFSSAQGIQEGSQVSISGVKIGEVSRIELDLETYEAMVTFRIEEEITIYDDSIVSVKSAGLIGDKYLAIDPGGGGFELEPGSLIVDTESALDLESLIGKIAFGSVEE